MKKKLLQAVKVLVFLSLGLFLVWFAVRGMDVHQILHAFDKVNYGWIILSLSIGMLSHLSRAMRWKLMLETLGHQPKLNNTFFAVMIGYMANYAPIPRLGEASRCGILKRYEKIPFTESFGTVIAERLIDVLCLMLVFFITFLVQFDKINGLAHEYVLDPLARKLGAVQAHPVLAGLILLVCIGGIVLFVKFRKKTGTGIISKAFAFITGFFDGLKTVKNLKRPGLFVMHTVFIWVVYYVTFHMCLFSLPETATVTFREGISIFALGTLGVVFTPGGLGAYQIIVQNSLLSFLILRFPADQAKTISAAFPWVVWSSQFILIVGMGLVSLILLPLLNKEQHEGAATHTA